MTTENRGARPELRALTGLRFVAAASVVVFHFVRFRFDSQGILRRIVSCGVTALGSHAFIGARARNDLGCVGHVRDRLGACFRFHAGGRRAAHPCRRLRPDRRRSSHDVRLQLGRRPSRLWRSKFYLCVHSGLLAPPFATTICACWPRLEMRSRVLAWRPLVLLGEASFVTLLVLSIAIHFPWEKPLRKWIAGKVSA